MNIDMHCHLDLYPDPFKVVAECKRKGTYVLSVTTTPKAWNMTSKLELGNNRIRTALGLHPQLAHHRSHELELFDALLPVAKYIGEIGLDGGKDYKDHWEVQLKVFRHILRSVNRAGGRIMSIHSLQSVDTVLDELLRTEGIPILHWFTGTQNQLTKAIDLGCWFSVGPAMLKTKKGLEILSKMPIDRILTETDGPFTNENGRAFYPWDVTIANEKLAFAWKCKSQESASIIENNFKNLLSRMS